MGCDDERDFDDYEWDIEHGFIDDPNGSLDDIEEEEIEAYGIDKDEFGLMDEDERTQTLTDMPGNTPKSNQKMEAIIVKILDLENSINEDIDKLVALKKEILAVLGMIERAEHRVVLEKRYLNNQPWEKIACDMGCGIDNIY